MGTALLVQSLTAFANFVVKGEVLDSAKLFLFGASLVALQLSKADGSVRPIAV